MRAYNVTRDQWLVTDLEVAGTVFKRMLGLMGRPRLSVEQGLWIKPCNSIHTFGMRFPIDVVFLNEEGRVVKVISEINPCRVVLPVTSAVSVLELPPGTIARTQTDVGDVISVATGDEQSRFGSARERERLHV